MSERVTYKELQETVNEVNRLIQKTQPHGWKYRVRHAYNYYELERINLETGYPYGNPVVIGTKAKVNLVLRGMMEILSP